METLDQLIHFSPRDFELWLESRLRNVYARDPSLSYFACDFRHLGIPFSESPLDSLTGLFRRLPIDAKESFRHALELLVRHVQPGDFPSDAMADIVSLVGQTGAFTAFGAFVPVLGNGPWGELFPFLIYDALSALMMFDRAREAYEAVRGLASSHYFLDGYAYDAYILLVRSRPECWSADFALLRERFARNRDNVLVLNTPHQTKVLKQREKDVAIALATIPLTMVANQMGQLCLSLISDLEPVDSWLIHCLFSNSGPLSLRFDPLDDLLYLFDTYNNACRSPVPECPDFEIFCLRNNLFQAPRFHCARPVRLSPSVLNTLNGALSLNLEFVTTGCNDQGMR